MKTTRRNRRRRIIEKILSRKLNGTRNPRARKMKLNGFAEYDKPPVSLLFRWSNPTFVQGGSNGIVYCEKPYRTAYFEAFPKILNEVIPTRRRIRRHRFTSVNGDKIILNPSGWQDLYIRGEGRTIRHAEIDCWLRYRRFHRCRGHVMDRCGYTNGGCFCIKCGLFGSLMEPTTSCHVCGVKTKYSLLEFEVDPKERWFCEEHRKHSWDDPDLSEFGKKMVNMFRGSDDKGEKEAGPVQH